MIEACSEYREAASTDVGQNDRSGEGEAGTEEGPHYAIEAGSEHRVIAVPDFGEPLMATPAVSEGLLLVRTPTKLWALGRGRD